MADEQATDKAKGPDPGQGVSISIGGSVSQSQVVGAGGDVVVEGSFQAAGQPDALAAAFAAIYQRIEARPPDPKVDKAEVKEAVEKIEAEVKQGEAADPGKVEMRLRMLAAMAPDILEVAAATLANPIAGVATVIRKVAEKARAELAAGPPAPPAGKPA
jgi:hypothetical protein